MKSKTLAVLAGVGAPLVLTGSASAGFVGIEVVQKTVAQDKFSLFVCNIYAVFDRPDQDEMVAVAGTPNNPLNIFAKQGKFYQHPEGSPLTAPLSILLPGMDGQLAYDTFLTIGVKVDDFFTAADDVSTSPGLAFENDSISTTNGSWFIVPSGAGQGGNGAPTVPLEGGLGVLIGQFSVFKDGIVKGVAGQMLLQFTSNGDPGVQAFVTFDHQIPTPAAVALLGLGALGARRRRR